MAVICKPTVRFKGFTYSLLTILDTLVWLDAHKVKGQPEDIVITSANDSTHKANSKHYSNEALDVRSKTMSADTRSLFIDALRKELGAAFTVLYEYDGTPNAHLHIQVAKKKA
jgi:hypothetical protein